MDTRRFWLHLPVIVSCLTVSCVGQAASATEFVRYRLAGTHKVISKTNFEYRTAYDLSEFGNHWLVGKPIKASKSVKQSSRSRRHR